MAAKYILFEWPSPGFIPVTFSEALDQNVVADGIKAVRPGVNPVSAGLYSKNNGQISVWGGSTTLHLHSDPQDAVWLNNLLNAK